MNNSLRIASTFVRVIVGLVRCVLGVLGCSTVSVAQIVLDRTSTQLTLEGYGNLTTAAVENDRADEPDPYNLSAGLRALGRLKFESRWDIGARLSVESVDSDVRLSETSLLLFGAGGRIELGERSGLPDVLTGYAPNNFTFTTAEFGPASGPSLDPAGRLQTEYVDSELAGQINAMTGLGVAAALLDDQSFKILYVSPKRGGWLGGLSYAPDADDARYRELLQAGLTHETYWRQNVLRVGGSYAFAQASSDAGMPALRDMHSVGFGAAVTLDDALMLGLAVSYDGRSGLPTATEGVSVSRAWGVTTSVNYNTGPWTLGAYYQFGRAAGDANTAGDDRLSALEAGVSYRWTTKLRAYGGWFYYDFTDEGGAGGRTSAGNVFLFGIRAAL